MKQMHTDTPAAQMEHESYEPAMPAHQHAHEGLPVLDQVTLFRRRENVFLLFAGLFLGSLTMLNILGITRFIKLFSHDFDGDPGTGPTLFLVAVGVLPYPITFLCTDFISELFGKRRANAVVWMGLILNIWVMSILWVGGNLPGFESAEQAAQITSIAKEVAPTIEDEGLRKAFLAQADRKPVFFEVRTLAFGAVIASMLAYLAAQFIDVHVFHFWKKKTDGKHLWLRNNGSTLVSQLVDTVAVILITYWIGGLAGIIKPDQSIAKQLAVIIATGYVFKMIAALLDTIPFYIGTHHLVRYLRLPPPGKDPA
ncbi:MAG: queuosine precursor transporter [Phycisphaerales bacterium]|nr:queuosine precursor transporter [Phycisphaerales bacterium]